MTQLVRFVALVTLVMMMMMSSSECASNEKISNFALTLRVSLGEIDATLEQMTLLLAHAKSENMNQNLQMFLRTALDKVTQSKDEMDKANSASKLRELAKKGPAIFTNSTVAVKPLKAASVDKKKRGNVPVYTVKEFAEKLSKKKIDDQKPFLVTDAVDDLPLLQSVLQASELMNDETVEIRYISPVVAKRKRSFSEQQQHVPEEEQYESTIITFERYFRNCFNHKSKADFKKVPGSDTEHCEQTLPANLVYSNISSYELTAIKPHWKWMDYLERGREFLFDKASELTPMVSDDLDVRSHLAKSDSRFVVLGPAGSGDQLKKEKTGFVDGLVHGKRKWFFMSPEKFTKLREVAKDTLEAASAFMFFEQQLGELKEEHELGGKGLEFWETLQLPGDLLFVPGNMIKAGLALEDSISYKQQIVATREEAVAYTNGALWQPESGVIPNGYMAASCYGFEFNQIPLGPQLHPQQAGLIEQVFKQYYGSPKAENSLILTVLDKCTRQIRAKELKLDGLTPCDVILPSCVQRLQQNLEKLKVPVPSWLPGMQTWAKPIPKEYAKEL